MSLVNRLVNELSSPALHVEEKRGDCRACITEYVRHGHDIARREIAIYIFDRDGEI